MTVNITENELAHLLITNVASGKKKFVQIDDNLYEKIEETIIYKDDPIGTIYKVIR